MRDSGYPILLTASKVLLASNSALGFAFPMSSLAKMSMRLAINFTSSPPSIMRASQYTAAFGSLPRMLLIKAEIIS